MKARSITIRFILSLWILLFLTPIMYIKLCQMTVYGPLWNTPEPFFWEVLVIMGILGEVLAVSSAIDYLRRSVAR